MEQSGKLSLFYFEETEERIGLMIVPPWELEPPRWLHQGERVSTVGIFGCVQCGYTEKFPAEATLPRCPHCGHNIWTDHVGGEQA